METIPYTYRLYTFLYSALCDQNEMQLRFLPAIGETQHNCPKLTEQEWQEKVNLYLELDKESEEAFLNGDQDACEALAWEGVDLDFLLCFGWLTPIIENGNILVEFG